MNGATKVSDMMIMIAIGLSVFLGMMTFMGELDNSYSLTVPDNSSDDIEQIFTDMNTTSNELQSTLTGDQSWLETTFNIVFRLPNQATSTIVTLANSAGKLLGVATGENMANVPVPGWIVTLVFMIVSIVIITTLVYVIFGRGF